MTGEPEASGRDPLNPAIPLASVEWDAEGRVAEWSPEAERLFGWRADEVRGKRSSEWRFVHPDDRERVARVAAALGSGRARQTFSANRNLTRDGRVLHCEWYNTALHGKDGAVAAQFSLVLDVTGRVEAEERARTALERAEAARLAAEEASRAKSIFLATMSHEIRTPINAVVGYVDLLEMGIQGAMSPGQRGYLDRIRASSRHLLGLVNDVLDFARIEAGEIPFTREPVPLGEAVADAVSMVVPLASARGIAVVEEPLPGRGALLGDADRIRQILLNLLSNAVKFTQPGGRVSVRCLSSAPAPEGAGPAGPAGWAAVEVEDTGIGIAPEHLERVFEPFTQVDESHTRAVGGTGLGLAISRRFALLMGGDLAVRSEPGTGSVFTLSLPAAAAAASRAEPAPEAAIPAGAPHAFAAAGRALEEGADELVGAWAARVARDPDVPSARGLRREQVEDHTTTFVTELGRTLTILGTVPDDAERSDSASIQRTIAALHGAQRARLGFTSAEVAREFLILSEEMESFLRRRWSGEPLPAVLDALKRMLDRAARVAVESHAAVPRSGRLLGRTRLVSERTAETVRRMREEMEERDAEGGAP